ncbi:MAG: AbrB family transcriptional regulator [Burkholderiales bacterium]|nr:MAG: AbrB family transcriptional regulator [Burkholderiales bacterium]
MAFLKALAIGAAGGALCTWLGTPLPWLLGALFACAGANLAGAGLWAPVAARWAGQWVIGMALGLYFTQAVLGRLLALWPFLLAGTIYALLLGMGFAWALSRFGGADAPTAFFGGAVGGASEMASQGERFGGSVPLIAAGHSLRVLLVVTILPFAYQWLQVHGSDAWVPVASVVDYRGLVALLVLSWVGGMVALRVGSPNAWVLGPLFVTAALGIAGLSWTALPRWLIDVGQVLIGISLGTRFAPGFFARGPRFLAAMAVASLAGIAASALFGWALALGAGIAPATMILATSPGGIAEMSLTAKLLQLGVPVVAIMHVVRYIGMVLSIGALYRLLARRFGWQAGDGRGQGEPG